MEIELDVIKIVEQWLIDNGYDGLYDDDFECACEVGNLAPCGDYFGCCKPGYKHPGDDEYDFYIRVKKECGVNKGIEDILERVFLQR